MKNSHKKSAGKSRNTSIVVIAVVATIVLVVYIAWLDHKNYRNERIIQAEENLLTIARSTASSLEAFLEQHSESLKVISLNPLVQYGVHSKIIHDESDIKYCPIKALYEVNKGAVNALTVLDDNGIVLHRHPFIKDRPGMNHSDKPGATKVLREHKSHLSNLFINNLGNPAISISEPVFWEDKFAGIVRWMIEIETICTRFIHPIKIGDKGNILLWDVDGTIYRHPDHKYIGKKIEHLQKEKTAGEEKKEKEMIKKILAISEGYDTFIFDELSDELACFAWTYVTINPLTSGTAGIKIEYDTAVPKELHVKKARILAEEIDKKIPRIEDLLNTENLKNILKDVQAKYPDIIEITIHGPRSAEDSTLLYKVSTSPNLEGKLSDPEDVQAVKDEILKIRFAIQKQGRPHAGKNVVDVTVPIHTCEANWPLVAFQPYSEIAGPINKHAINTFGFAGLIILLIGSGGLAFYITQKRKIVFEAVSAEALRESEQKLSCIIASVTDHMSMMDSENNIIWANDVAKELFGQDLVGKKCYTAYHGFKKACEPCIVKRTFEDGKAHEHETETIGADGNHMTFWCTASVATQDSQGRPKTVVEVSRNITDRKMAEAKLKQYANTQEVLVREVNHRVKNNLAAIIGILAMEEERAEKKGDTSYFYVLQDLTARIKGLSTVHGLLSASGWQPLKLSLVCEQILKGAIQAAPSPKNIEISITPSPVTVNSTHAHHLAMVINELAINTIKHGMANRDKIRINIIIEQDGSKTTIQFKDNGPGFPEEIVKGDLGGSNIGFELIQGIVMKSLGGNIVFKNDNGAVTTISFENEINIATGRDTI